jgi:hypothetical protein
LVLCLTTAGALATSPTLRSMAIAGLRSIAEPLFERGEASEPQFDAFYTDMVDALPAQERAERALELAINRYTGAAEYILQNAQSWRGQIQPNERLTALLSTAFNAPLIEVRMAGFEVHLAQYDLEKSTSQVDRLIERFNSDPHGAGPWALWNMAAIGARGIDRERVFDRLLLATRNEDDYVRHWAVDALSKFGGTEIIAPLLELAGHDRSATVREGAFCGLAESGTLHIAERYEALPGLLAITESAGVDRLTLDWAYQALREITGVRDMQNDPWKWRERLEHLRLIGEPMISR